MGKINKKEKFSKPLDLNASAKGASGRDRFWRKHIDSTVVDLRKIRASASNKKTVKAQKEKKEKKPPSRRVNRQVAPAKKRVSKNSDRRLPMRVDVLSQDEILRQISEVEMQDVLIEQGFTNLQKNLVELAAMPSAPITPQQESFSNIADDQNQNKKAIAPKVKINLIPPTIQTADLKMPPKSPVSQKEPVKVVKERLVRIPENLPIYVEEKPRPIPEKQLKKFALRDNYSKRDPWLRNRRPIDNLSRHRAKKIKTLVFAVFTLFIAGSALISFKAVAFQEEATIRAEKAYSYMNSGKNALEKLETDEAKEYFLKAEDEFTAIEEGFGFLPVQTLNLATVFPFQSKFSSAAHLIKAGKQFSKAGYEIASALASLKRLPSGSGSIQEQSNFTDNLVIASTHIKEAKNYISGAESHLSRVRPEDVPASFEGEILNLQNYSGYVEELFDEALSSLDVLLSFLGHQEEKVYMIAFQNSSELRATGGFMGTYGLLYLNKGSIKELNIDGIYNPDGQLSVNIIPPKPLQYVTPNFGTRDANWFFDFPLSAEKIMEMFIKTGGPESDGVIGITPSIVENLLRLTGPIEMPEYGVTLDANNFLELVQQEVEQDYDRELNRPKQILTDLAPILLEKLEKSDKQIEVLNILFEGLGYKDIMLYSKDKNVQKFLEEKNWDGGIEMARSSESVINDYLAVVFSNIGGWKTDRYMDTEVDTVTEIDDNGDIIRTVIISRRHNGGSTPYKWYNRPNYGYMRIYVPEGSELLSAEGFSEEPDYINTNYAKERYVIDPMVAQIETTLYKHNESNTDIFVESEKTVFGNWMLVPAGERKFAQIKYKLPQKANLKVMSYNLTIQKQSGLPVDYSGSVEGLKDFLGIKNCWLEGKPLFSDNQFAFFQTNDKDISCR
ncbi:MAG: DUF4012 domain-containing protein [Candidatus Spechtbacterales bacterium]